MKLLSFLLGDPARLLKKATEHHNEGRFEKAIKCLRKAYRALARGQESYPIETFLRLPLYLQKAGRFDEAWQEFQKLLDQGYPNQLADPGVRMMERAAIYDKMRLALQRQGNPTAAAAYGLSSYLAQVHGLSLQSRAEEVAQMVSEANIAKTVRKLWPPGAPSASEPQMTALLSKHLDFLPDVDVDRISAEANRIFSGR